MARYIFITGGVVSSLGKGLASAALGAVLQARGYKFGSQEAMDFGPAGQIFQSVGKQHRHTLVNISDRICRNVKRGRMRLLQLLLALLDHS